MAEPTVAIPVRVALQAAQNLHWLSTLTRDKYSEKLKSLSVAISQSIGDQCSLEEVKAAAVAAKLDERT